MPTAERDWAGWGAEKRRASSTARGSSCCVEQHSVPNHLSDGDALNYCRHCVSQLLSRKVNNPARAGHQRGMRVCRLCTVEAGGGEKKRLQAARFISGVAGYRPTDMPAPHKVNARVPASLCYNNLSSNGRHFAFAHATEAALCAADGSGKPTLLKDRANSAGPRRHLLPPHHRPNPPPCIRRLFRSHRPCHSCRQACDHPRTLTAQLNHPLLPRPTPPRHHYRSHACEIHQAGWRGRAARGPFGKERDLLLGGWRPRAAYPAHGRGAACRLLFPRRCHREGPPCTDKQRDAHTRAAHSPHACTPRMARTPRTARTTPTT